MYSEFPWPNIPASFEPIQPLNLAARVSGLFADRHSSIIGDSAAIDENLGAESIDGVNDRGDSITIARPLAGSTQGFKIKGLASQEEFTAIVQVELHEESPLWVVFSNDGKMHQKRIGAFGLLSSGEVRTIYLHNDQMYSLNTDPQALAEVLSGFHEAQEVSEDIIVGEVVEILFRDALESGKVYFDKDLRLEKISIINEIGYRADIARQALDAPESAAWITEPGGPSVIAFMHIANPGNEEWTFEINGDRTITQERLTIAIYDNGDCRVAILDDDKNIVLTNTLVLPSDILPWITGQIKYEDISQEE